MANVADLAFDPSPWVWRRASRRGKLLHAIPKDQWLPGYLLTSACGLAWSEWPMGAEYATGDRCRRCVKAVDDRSAPTPTTTELDGWDFDA